MSVRVEVVSGPLAGKSFPVKGSSFSVGREAGNDLVLEDSTVSRRHVLIVPDASGAVIRDLGSRNGILLDGRPVREGRLAHGTGFSVGRIACRYLSVDPSPSPAAPSAPRPSTPSGKAPGGFDRRFALVLGASFVVVAIVLAVWYRNVHDVPVQDKTLCLKQGEERYEPTAKPLRDCVVKDVKGDGVVTVLQRYRNALAFRASSEGDADLCLVYEDGSQSCLKVAVRGRKSPPVGMEIPPDVRGDASREEEFFRRKMSEAVARASEGKLRDAFVIARSTEGFYHDVMPKPAVAVEARNRALEWEKRLQDRLAQLEEERRHQSERKSYEEVDRVLREMKELVEEESAAHQRLRHIFRLNSALLESGRRRR